MAHVRPPSSLPPPQSPFRPLRQPSLGSVPTLGKHPVKLESSSNPRDDLDNPPAKRRRIDAPEGTLPGAPLVTETSDVKATVTPAVAPSGKHRVVPWSLDDVFPAPDTGNASPSKDTPPPQLPTRPWKHHIKARRLPEENRGAPRIRKKIPVPNIPDKMETPDLAPRIVGEALAGFFPWIGTHPEDVLNEQNVKQGYFDKVANPPEKETTSAKLPMSTAFKHRAGLDTLSALFSLVMEQKNRNGAIAPGSAFRPPPRVTLTEARRKIWLADLANSEISLRKLSRTIPQGIRGQQLLEQCLLNNVPVTRAVWFAKCVGANEIRTSKRKGTTSTTAATAEEKWRKEWTINVEQFIESIQNRCREPEWKDHAVYSFSLGVRLYSENLLDRDHFLDWVLKSTTTSDLDHLPFWLMTAQFHKEDLSMYRKRGRLLASLLVEKMAKVKQGGEELFQPLISKMTKFIRALVMLRPMTFLMPEHWPECQEILSHVLDLTRAQELGLFERLRRANESTSAAPALLHSSTESYRRMMIVELDRACRPYSIAKLSARCALACPNSSTRISTLFHWISTRFRKSKAHFYLGIRLLRLWHKQGSDLDTPFHRFVASARDSASFESETLHHLAAELSKSWTISISKYLQWLTLRASSRNSYSDCYETGFETSIEGKTIAVIAQRNSDASNLLTEVSIGHLPDHVTNLRNTTVTRLGFNLETEAIIVLHCKCLLAQSLPEICHVPDGFTASFTYVEPDMSTLGWTIKCQVAEWLKEEIFGYCKPTTFASEAKFTPGRGRMVTKEQFWQIRAYLEKLGDLAVLAEVLRVISNTLSEDVLAAVADTVNRHADTFAAIGAFECLHSMLFMAYTTLRESKHYMPLLAISLIDLHKLADNQSVSMKTLLSDLTRGDRANAVAACSPFSDGIAESLQQAGPTFIEQFEATLQSEISMTEQTMDQLFGLLTERIQKELHGGFSETSANSLCLLLTRLKLRRFGQYTNLLNPWIQRLLCSQWTPSMQYLFICLIGTDCVQFDTIVEASQQHFGQDAAATGSMELAIAKLLIDYSIAAENSLEYRLTMKRSQYLRRNPNVVLKMLGKIEIGSSKPRNASKYVDDVLLEVLSHVDVPRTLALASLSDASRLLLIARLNKLLLLPPSSQTGISSVDSILAAADDFSLPFCQLRLDLQMQDPRSLTQEAVDLVADTFLSVAIRDDTGADLVNSDRLPWWSLLSAAGPGTARIVRQKAAEAFFTYLPNSTQSKGVSLSQHSTGNYAEATKYLEIALHAGSEEKPLLPSQSTITAQLVEKFAAVVRSLGSTNTATPALAGLPSTPGPTSMSTPTAMSHMPSTPSSINPQATVSEETLNSIGEYLPLLLRMACLNRSTCLPPSPTQHSTVPGISVETKKVQSDHARLLILLVTIALHPALSSAHPQLSARTLNVAATLADNLPEESRKNCATRILRDKMQDPRVRWLFGSVDLCGSVRDEQNSVELMMVKDIEGKTVNMGAWKMRQWEVIESSGGQDGGTGLSLGLFGARVGS